MLFREGLRSLGYEVTSLQARVVRGLEIDAPRPMLHMVLRIDLPEGPFADVGFGNLAPTTAALRLRLLVEQDTPHEIMRFIAMGEELTLQAKLGERWEHIYRVVLLPRFDAEYDICNWFTGTHPQSPYLNNMIAARPGPNRTRLTLFNARFNVRHASGQVERRTLESEADYRGVLANEFGLELSDEELNITLAHVERRGRGPATPLLCLSHKPSSGVWIVSPRVRIDALSRVTSVSLQGHGWRRAEAGPHLQGCRPTFTLRGDRPAPRRHPPCASAFPRRSRSTSIASA